MEKVVRLHITPDKKVLSKKYPYAAVAVRPKSERVSFWTQSGARAADAVISRSVPLEVGVAAGAQLLHEILPVLDAFPVMMHASGVVEAKGKRVGWLPKRFGAVKIRKSLW